MNRRNVLKTFSAGVLPVAFNQYAGAVDSKPWLTLAVQQYSFNRQLRAGELTIADYPKTVVEGTGIKYLEYFNGHMEEKAGDAPFFKELRKITDDLGATNTMMLCRSQFALDSKDPAIRAKSIESYRPWLDAMRTLGGICIRVDVREPGDAEEQKKYATEGLRALTKVASDEYELSIVVENHGNHSSNGAWVADVMKAVDMEACGTLPDFQNFKEYDPYQGVQEMMPWAKIVCAKSKHFDEKGNETNVDYRRMLKIVKDSGYRGLIGIEFEGHKISPIEGINATKRLIETVMSELA